MYYSSLKKNICIIPARQGSKRLLGKNIKNFFGKPIIYYPIKEALKSKLFDRVIVSTDSKIIAKISKEFGADIHFREQKYCSDLIGIDVVIKKVIQYLSAKYNFNKVCCIFPTSVFFTKKNLNEAFKKLKKKNQYIFSAYKISEPIERVFFKSKGRVKMLMDKYYKKKIKFFINITIMMRHNFI